MARVKFLSFAYVSESLLGCWCVASFTAGCWFVDIILLLLQTKGQGQRPRKFSLALAVVPVVVYMYLRSLALVAYTGSKGPDHPVHLIAGPSLPTCRIIGYCSINRESLDQTL